MRVRRAPPARFAEFGYAVAFASTTARKIAFSELSPLPATGHCAIASAWRRAMRLLPGRGSVGAA